MKKLVSTAALAALFAVCACAQTFTLSTTTLATAVLKTDTQVCVASATGISTPTISSPGTMFFVDSAEAMQVVGAGASSTCFMVDRHWGAAGHNSGAILLLGPPNQFYGKDPKVNETCVLATTYVTPFVNIVTGDQWLCSTVTGTWVAGWQNKTVPAQPTTAVASAAGQVTPSGPLFHITGTAAITGFLLPLGFNYGGFCVIPDGAFTTTTANNIAAASTGVVSVLDCWTYDAHTGKFYPQY